MVIQVDSDVATKVLSGDPCDIEDAVVVCDEMEIAKISNNQVTHIACAHVCHGSHKRFEKVYGDFNTRFGEFLREKTIQDKNDCPRCSGSGWLEINSSESVKQVVLAMQIGMFRGVVIKVTEELMYNFSNGMIGNILNGQ